MRIEQVMTTDVRGCRPGDSLSDAVRIMWERDCGCVPVVDERNVVVGMVTDRDACMAAYTKGASLRDVSVREAMSTRVISCSPGDTLDQAEALMQRHQVRRLPVVSAERRLVGILSLNDIARAGLRPNGDIGLSAKAIEETLAAVCRPRAFSA